MGTYIGLSATALAIVGIALVLNAMHYSYALYKKHHSDHYLYWDGVMRKAVSKMDKLMVLIIVLFVHQFILQLLFKV